ncbi:MAG: polyphosphate kinase 1, partial [Acidimicrobiales bacterium]|nr:polyphosphate kinase 1 [Acidimicrobiales bacterium]
MDEGSPVVGRDGVVVVGGFDENPTPFLNRELSWLAFNSRVLALAADQDVPLLERVKFLAIFSSNLDEFFQVRVAGLKDQLAAGVSRTSPDGRGPAGALAEIAAVVSELVVRQERILTEEVHPDLARHGIRLVRWDELEPVDRAWASSEFEHRVFPVLTPLAVDPSHPFPYISNLSLNLAVLLRDPATERSLFARVKVPNIFPRFVPLPDGLRFLPLEDMIAAHLDALFPGMEVLEHHAFRVSRNADLTIEEEEADDLLAVVEMELRRRRFGRAVRLEVASTITPALRDLLVRELDLLPEDVYESPSGLLDLSGLFSIVALDRPDLKDPPWTPVIESPLDEAEDRGIFAVLEEREVLVHHPYDSFAGSVETFIRQAAVDPAVLAIKMTLYRTSGDSPIIEALVRAAEAGKQVAVLVELKARFDEEANIGWARRLEQAGAHVAYGIVGLKIHTKVCMVVRREGDGIHRYCHIGTGNYNSRTASLYEDLGLLTADPVVGDDVAMLFNLLTGYGRDVRYKRLLVAPDGLRTGLEDLIRQEMAVGGRIVMKMNSLVDTRMIELLYEASRAGVSIDLLVRGICCLRPGVPGLSDRIRVQSIVGRYL